MQLAHLRRVVGVTLLVLSLPLLVYALRPAERETRQVTFTSQELNALLDDAPTGSPGRTIFLEGRELILDWPSRLSAGGTQELRLTMEPQPAVASPANETNVYEIYTVQVQARLEIPSVQTEPAGEASQPMQEGQPIKFVWQVHPNVKGEYRGQAWLHLVFTPRSGEAPQRRLLTVQELSFQAAGLPGISLPTAQVITVVGVVVGVVLCFDLLLIGLRKAGHKS